jgi:hypothetical protein
MVVMELEHLGSFSREVHEGDPVILSSGATASFRRSYPKGYSGIAEILLDGAEEIQNTSSLTLPDYDQAAVDVDDVPRESEPQDGVRAPSLRMED